MITVKQMYDVDTNEPLLSSFSADFWNEYVTHHEEYDALFTRLYKSFAYFDQSAGETARTVRERFTDEVSNHLLINKRKYSELYRVHIASNLPIDENYSITETMDRDTSYNKGSRQDSNSLTTGSQSITNNGSVSPYDSEDFFNKEKETQSVGARTDSSNSTTGAQNDSSTEDYTLRKSGFINSSPVDLLNKHEKFWSKHEFYAYIFGEICVELLLV